MEGRTLTYLLDTAPWINGVTLPEVLPQRIRRLLGSTEAKGLCSVSLLEAAILYRLGRLDLAGTLAKFFAAGLSADLQVIELTPTIAVKTNGGLSLDVAERRRFGHRRNAAIRLLLSKTHSLAPWVFQTACSRDRRTAYAARRPRLKVEQLLKFPRLGGVRIGADRAPVNLPFFAWG